MIFIGILIIFILCISYRLKQIKNEREIFIISEDTKTCRHFFDANRAKTELLKTNRYKKYLIYENKAYVGWTKITFEEL